MGEFYDPEKETKYKEDRDVEAKNHGKDWVQKLPKAWRDEGSLYNPINCHIEDE